MKEIKYFCDRCKGELENKYTKLGLSLLSTYQSWSLNKEDTRFSDEFVSPINFDREMDLCSKCSNSLNMWLDQCNTNSPEKM